jgi:hypothetical protein
MSALFGGFLGSIFMFAIYHINIRIIDNPKNLITEFLLICMIYIGSLTANLFTGLFFSLVYPEKYNRRYDMIWQVFLINFFLFMLSFPVYVFMPAEIQTTGVLQIIFSIFSSSVIFEIYAGDGTYTISGLYGSLFGTFLMMVVLYLLKPSSFEGIFSFAVLPINWLVVTFFTLITEYLYSVFFKNYGIAALDPKTKW